MFARNWKTACLGGIGACNALDSESFRRQRDGTCDKPPLSDAARAASKVDLNDLWLDLEKGDRRPRTSSRLSSTPRESIAFYEWEEWKPLRIENEKVKALIDWLGSDDEAIWKPAFEELGWFDPRLEIDLVTLMSTVTQPPARQRLVEVLCGYKPGTRGQ